MSRVAALLAAALLLGGVAGCGGGGAEPGAPSGATLVLDFTPNAVHSGVYAAQRRDFYGDAGLELAIRQPGESTDAPKLLEAGRTEFAILDIHDLGIAAERGLDLVGVMSVVQRPLASVIVRADGPVRRPRDLEGRTVGVTGLPSDDAVVDSEVRADGGDPAKVKRVTIGFNAVSSLAAGRVDAVTAFWNAEGIALRRAGIPIRIFKVERFGAPSYPELILTTSRRTLREDPELVEAMVRTTTRGYRFTVDHPSQALNDLLTSVPSLNPADQQAQLDALRPILHPAPFDYPILRRWASWDVRHDLLSRDPAVGSLFVSP
jgi:NitT/TauT family transport system substrate-binding protein/putative hydroxymethylpyrimidine transport system substrate-binding protein